MSAPHIPTCFGRFFILENVQGCLKQSSNVSEDDPYKASVAGPL